MKKNKYLIFLLLLIIPLNVKAEVYINCKSPVKKDETFSCDVSVSKDKIKEFSLTVPEDTSHVKYVGVSSLGSFTDNSSNRNIKLNSSLASNGNVAKLNFKLLTDTQDYIYLKFVNISYILENGNLSGFDAQEHRFVVSKPTTTTTKKVLTTNLTTTSTIQNQTNKDFTVTFNYNNGTNKTINKTCSTTGANCNISLSDLEKPERLSFSFNGWGNAETCTEGNTTTYKATQDTTLYACWKANVSDETLYLDSLVIEGQTIDFSKFNLNYDLTVLYEIEELKINATPSGENIKVDLKDSYPLEVGENIITIKLSDEEKNTSNSYIIKVNRLKEGEEIRQISSDATLKSLKIQNYDINFNSEKFDYTIQISSKITSLDITAEANDEFAEYLIENNNNLEDGSIIKITVKAEDGTINTYMINIEVVKGLEDYLIYILAGGVGLILIIVIVIIKATKNKKAKTRKQKVSKSAPTVTKQTKNAAASISPVKPINVQNKALNLAVKQVPKQVPVTPETPKVTPAQVPVTPETPKVTPAQVPVTPETPKVTPVIPKTSVSPQPVVKQTQNNEKLETLDL